MPCSNCQFYPVATLHIITTTNTSPSVLPHCSITCDKEAKRPTQPQLRCQKAFTYASPLDTATCRTR